MITVLQILKGQSHKNFYLWIFIPESLFHIYIVFTYVFEIVEIFEYKFKRRCHSTADFKKIL